MKPLILFTAMTVIVIIGIIGTVEYAHAHDEENAHRHIDINDITCETTIYLNHNRPHS